MITFIVFTIIGWLATASLSKILYISIQDGQWLDKLLNWQDRLHQWDISGNEFLAKAGGYCELCFCHWISFISFWVYVLFMNVVLGYWITAPVGTWVATMLVNFVWYLTYVGIGTNLSLYFITKLFQK